MKTQFGLRNVELVWFTSYLANREEVCDINGCISSSKTIKTGVPQGSILGPLLFLLYINDLLDCLHNTTPCLYVDDTEIFASFNDYAELIDSLNFDLNNISQWLAKNKLQHHPTKTKVMIIGSFFNLNNKVYDYPVMLNSKVIPRTNSFEYLGVLIDEKLSWDLHVDKTCKKVGSSIAVMKQIMPFVPNSTLQTIYKAMTQPYFDDCSPLWGYCSAYLKEKLQRFQNRAERIISGANYEINSADVLESLGWQTLEERRKRNKSKLMYRILNNRVAPILKEQFTRSSNLPENYNLRCRRTDLILPNPKRDYLKKALSTVVQNYGIASPQKQN